MPSNHRRLALAVRARRDELDLTQMQVAALGGPSNATLTKVEDEEGTEGISRATLRKLDAALKWEPGSARRVYSDQGDPTPIDHVGFSASAWEELRQHVLGADLPDEAQHQLLSTIEQLERGA